MGRRKFTEELKEMRQAEIVEAARKVFSENGYERTTVAGICAEAEISHGTFYHYFKDKLSVMEAVLDEFLGRIRVYLDVWGAELPNAPEGVADFIKRGWSLLIEFFIENMDITRIFFQEAYRSGDVFNTRIKTFQDAVTQTVAQHLNRGVELGMLYPCDTGLTADLIVSVIERAFYKFAIGEVGEPLESYVEKAALFIERAIVKRDTTAGGGKAGGTGDK